VDRRRETVDGHELTLAVNHLAPFLLTLELVPLLVASAPARVVTVSSANHTSVTDCDLDDIQSRTRYRWTDVYARSKLANILFTRAIAKRLEGTGVTANCGTSTTPDKPLPVPSRWRTTWRRGCGG
jgi:NAD(P)-dependent dehydrogenase (short-subunit alcohol dehydrogenase family)